MSGPGGHARIVNLGTWSRPDAEPEQVGAAIACRGLRKSFGDQVAVDGLDLEVPSGRITALLGPSGCGKTTTLRLIAGLESPDAGSVEIDGRLVSGGGEHGQVITGHRVQAANHLLGTRRGGLEARHLTPGVYAGVGSPGNRQPR